MFMRVRVALPITKPLRRGGFIAGSDGERSWVTFKYERLPMFCHFCGILGHDLSTVQPTMQLRNGEDMLSISMVSFLRQLGVIQGLQQVQMPIIRLIRWRIMEMRQNRVQFRWCTVCCKWKRQ